MGIDATMFAKINELDYSEEKRKHWSYIFGSAFHQYLILGFDENIYHKPLEKLEIFEQDGPDIMPEPGKVFLNIPLAGRYYGPGYERGSLITYISIAEFLEVLLPNPQIYYGGDSSGVCAELFDSNKRTEFLNYFIQNNGHDNYQRSFERGETAPNCPVCEVKMIQNGFGPKFKRFTCLGCGWNVVEKDNITTKGFKLPY